jgi:chemotaxis protein MotB
MNKIQTVSQMIVLSAVIAATGCVSAGKYHDLEASHTATEASLAACETAKADLERRLGITSSQKTELEGSVATMKRALTELEARRAETEKRLAEFRELTAKFKELVDAGKLTIKVRNGRMMLALSSDILFSSGSAQLSTAGSNAIKEVTGLLKELNNRNFQIEGHTDNVPIHTKQFPSNWELASARASSVLNTMLAEGFPPEHVSLASYGKYDPVSDNSTPEAKGENRRIAIVVVPDLSGLPGFDELNRMSKPAAPVMNKAPVNSNPQVTPAPAVANEPAPNPVASPATH